jgi:MerR family regulatory protein
MNIGELARVADTKAETIRYYERIGLLPPPPRTAGNYRGKRRRALLGRCTADFRSLRARAPKNRGPGRPR